MIKKLKEAWVIIIFIGVITSLCGVLYAEQNKKIDQKVDNVVLQQMIKVLEIKQEIQVKVNEDSKEVDQRMIDALNNLNIQIVKLNEQLKRE